jgi:hypothetical protein
MQYMAGGTMLHTVVQEEFLSEELQDFMQLN